jgi:hypothetical protein
MFVIELVSVLKTENYLWNLKALESSLIAALVTALPTAICT